MDSVELTEQKLDVGALNDLVADETCGAVTIFIGTTRNNFESKEVSSHSRSSVRFCLTPFKRVIESITSCDYLTNAKKSCCR